MNFVRRSMLSLSCVAVLALAVLCPTYLRSQSSPVAPKVVVVRAGRLLDVKTGKTLIN